MSWLNLSIRWICF